VADAELSGDAARVIDVFDAAALLVPAELLRTFFGPEAHGHADDFVALLMQQRSGDGAIDPAGHAHHHAGAPVWLCYHACVSQPRGEGAVSLNPESLAQRAVDVLSEHKALDIALIDISKTASFTDYFVVATAQSPLQFSALQEYLEKDLGPEGVQLRHREGTPDSGWMLLDFGDLIVHIFSPDQRAYYRLEELWGRTSPVVRFAD
jgi:ribosome-associated protein